MCVCSYQVRPSIFCGIKFCCKQILLHQPMQLPSTREDLRRTDEIISEIDEVYFREGDSSCQYELQVCDAAVLRA